TTLCHIIRNAQVEVSPTLHQPRHSRLDVCFVSSAPVKRHARASGHPVPVALLPLVARGDTRRDSAWLMTQSQSIGIGLLGRLVFPLSSLRLLAVCWSGSSTISSP